MRKRTAYRETYRKPRFIDRVIRAFKFGRFAGMEIR